ncbi:MAG: transketolase C-terminal domain-containing protein [Microbacteriaceae bacterium]
MALETRVHAASLAAFGARNPEALVLSADLTSSTEADAFRDAFPDRFIGTGMAEQNMMSVAGGLAREGFLPMMHTFAVFMYRRALDQLEMSIAYPNLPVFIVGFLPGITTPGGVSHQAINDVNVMRGIPNMHILECGDATEVESVLDVAKALKAPVYLRMIRGSIPRLFDTPFVFNTARVLSEGDDLLILSSGISTETTINALETLKSAGVSATHLHISTLKPFTDPIVVEQLKRAKHIITVENHSVIGGLGTAVSELMAEHGVSAKLNKLGMQDTYASGASKEFLMREYGLDEHAILNTVQRVLGISLDQNELDAAAVIESTNTIDRQETPDEAL